VQQAERGEPRQRLLEQLQVKPDGRLITRGWAEPHGYPILDPVFGRHTCARLDFCFGVDSNYTRPMLKLAVGQIVPEFAVQRRLRQPVTLSELVAEGPAVLHVYILDFTGSLEGG